MPLKIEDIKKYSIQIAEKEDVFVWIGPCASKKESFKRIPIDGRKYECGGKILLANGQELNASFRLQKTEEPLLISDSIYIKIDGVWYKLGEPDFYEKTGLEESDIFPFEWIPDIPLDHKNKGPYKINFKGD
ncbi:MAG: hypothetical protein AB7S50_05070 [Bacteroidales bacterium]